MDPLVSTAYGQLRGRRDRNVDIYKGIRYARPPVGNLRFREPHAPSSWTGERQATDFGSAVPQSGPARAPAYADQDWLTLNVWAPATARGDAPVLVWIHGGAYMAGSSADPMYDGADLARSGLVVVTINYRVGAEGFARITGAPNNRGLLDQIAALEWVRDNIEAFGGNSHRVTIAGQSSGAGSVGALMCMPRARGLFHRAIAQSFPGMYCTESLAAEITERLATRLSAAPTRDSLAAIDPQTLADETDLLMAEMPEHAARWGRITGIGAPFCPIVDGKTLPTHPCVPSPDHRTDVDLLVGHTRDEFRLFMGMLGDLPVTAEMADTAISAHVPGVDPVAAYRTGYPTSSDRELFEIVHSDALFRMPAVQLAETHSAAGGATHVYEFCWEPALPTGAFHSLDIPALFGTLDAPAVQAALDGRPAVGADIVCDVVRRSWIGFVADGDPGWEPFTGNDPATRLLDTSPATVPYPEQVSRRIWQGHPATLFDLTLTDEQSR